MNGFIKKSIALYTALGLVILTSGLYLFPITTHAACGNGYSFCQTVTVNHLKVPADQTNFTFVATSTQTTLKTTGNGGSIQNTVSFNGQTVPADLVFTSDSACTTLLSWDFASYSATAGTIEAWILLSTIHTGSDDVVYMCYGKSSVSTYQGGSVGAAYDSNYMAVYHLADGSTLNLNDSTSNGRTVTNNNTSTAATGQIDGGVNFTHASNQYLSLNTAAVAAAMSYEGWVKATSLPSAYNTAISTNVGGSDYFDLHVKSDGTLAEYLHTGVNIDYDGTGSHTLSTGTWYYVAMTYDSTSGLIGYVNAASDGSAAANGALNLTATKFAIGSDFPVDNTRSFDGVEDEIRVSSVARSANWITTEYNNQAGIAFVTFGAEQAGSSAPPAPQHKFVFQANHKFIFQPNHTTVIQ